jgi:hypothetical protein
MVGEEKRSAEDQNFKRELLARVPRSVGECGTNHTVQVISHRENLRRLLELAHLQDRSSLSDEGRDVIF